MRNVNISEKKNDIFLSLGKVEYDSYVNKQKTAVIIRHFFLPFLCYSYSAP